MFYAVSFS